jgi:hypothetical protein
MASKEHRLIPAPGSRVIERRTRTRVRPFPDEIFLLFLVAAPLAAAVRASARGMAQLARRLHMASLPRLDQLDQLDQHDLTGSPTLVRVSGQVEPLAPAFETPGQMGNAVFARSIFVIPPAFRRQTATYTDETRGVDFSIRLRSGEHVQVAARDVRLHDQPRRMWSPNVAELQRRGGHAERSLFLRMPPFVRESVVQPGDLVEAAGVLVREVAPDGEAALGRGTPLVTRLRPAPGATHLWLRRV